MSTWYVDGKVPTRKNKSPEHDIQCALVGLLEGIEPTPLYTATVGGVRPHDGHRQEDEGGWLQERGARHSHF